MERLFHLDSWRGFFVVETIQNMIEYKVETLKDFMTCLLRTDNTDCNWDMNDSLVYFILLNFISLKSIDWNRGIKQIRYEKIKNLGFYKVSLWLVFFFKKKKMILIPELASPNVFVLLTISIALGCFHRIR